MSEDLYAGSLVAQLNEQGFVPVAAMKPPQLPGEVAMHAVSYGMGIYSDLFVLPAIMALEGSRCRPADERVTLVYARINRGHPNYKEGRIHLISLECIVDNRERRIVHLR